MVHELLVVRREARLDQAIGGVVVDDLRCPGRVDVHLEEIGQVPVALDRDAAGADQADRSVMHRVRSRLDEVD